MNQIEQERTWLNMLKETVLCGSVSEAFADFEHLFEVCVWHIKLLAIMISMFCHVSKISQK